MQSDERARAIVEMVRGQGFQSIEALAEHFKVTPQTVRRDVNQLCDRGLLRRRHGGVELPPRGENIAYSARQVLHLEAKRRIAEATARHIPHGVSVSLGIGTTPEQVAHALARHRNLQVMTNNLNVAMALSDNDDIEVIIAGGRLRRLDRDVIGGEALRFFDRFKVDFAIFGVGGVDTDGTLLDFSEDEVQLRQSMAANCRQSLLVLDQSKFGRPASVRGGHVADLDFIFTDQPLPAHIAELIAASRVDVHICEPRAQQGRLEQLGSSP